MSKTEVRALQEFHCDFCQSNNLIKRALYDGKTRLGYWSYMCQEHFYELGLGLGTGKGQRLIYEDKK